MIPNDQNRRASVRAIRSTGQGRGWSAIVTGAVTLFLLAAGMPFAASAEERWPRWDALAAVDRSPADHAATIVKYQKAGKPYLKTTQYTTDDYLCRGNAAPFSTDETFIVDEFGVPKRRKGDDSYYHPLNVARNTITYATNYFAGPKPETLPRLRAGADKMLELMTKSGGMPYPVEFHYYAGNHMLQPGWTSSMTQGTALSAFARAYRITCDERYLEGGRRALGHLLIPIEDGGTAADLRYLDPSLAHYVWYEEYPNPTKPAYTLNGFMYTLVGIYDWSTVDPDSDARRAFDDGIVTLTKILPYFDYDGFSAYDLAPIVYGTRPNFSERYHNVHLTLLSALFAITHEPTLDAYAERWYRRVGGVIKECRPQPRPGSWP